MNASETYVLLQKVLKIAQLWSYQKVSSSELILKVNTYYQFAFNSLFNDNNIINEYYFSEFLCAPTRSTIRLVQ